MLRRRWILVALPIFGLGLLSACEEEGPYEQQGEMIEEQGDQYEEATDEYEDQMEELDDEIETTDPVVPPVGG